MDIARQVLSVLLVIALAALLAWRSSRGGWRRPAWRAGLRDGEAAPLEVVARVALTPQHAVHLLRCEGRSLLVATHAQGCSLLASGAAGKEDA